MRIYKKEFKVSEEKEKLIIQFLDKEKIIKTGEITQLDNKTLIIKFTEKEYYEKRTRIE